MSKPEPPSKLEPTCNQSIELGATWDNGPKFFYRNEVDPCDKPDCPVKAERETEIDVKVPGGGSFDFKSSSGNNT